jgi:hypothetical protein
MNPHAVRRRIAWEDRATVRRRLVGMLYLTGQYTLAEIADTLEQDHAIETSISQVSQDLNLLRDAWGLQAKKSPQQWLQDELMKLDNLEAHLISSLGPIEVVVPADTSEFDLVEQLQVAGELQAKHAMKFAEAMLKIADRRARLLGLDAPRKLAIDAADHTKPPRLTAVTDAELEEFLARQLQPGARQDVPRLSTGSPEAVREAPVPVPVQRGEG